MVRPMLGDVELQLVQEIEVDGDQVLKQHSIPALEGDFLQRLNRCAARVTLSGVITGDESAEGLKALHEKYHAAEPVEFVADITTATRIDQVLIESMGVRELAGKPARFEYAFTLREYIEAEPADTEDPTPVEPPDPVPEIEDLVGTLVVEVVVENQPNFDFSQVTVTVRGEQDDGTPLNRTLTNRVDNVWTEEEFPAGSYTVEAVAVMPTETLTGSESAVVRAGQTTTVRIVLRSGQTIAHGFIIHFTFDRAFIHPCLMGTLRDVADYAAAHGDEKIVIVGHTDRVGSDEYNLSLGDRRGRTVYAALTYASDPALAVAEWDAIRKPSTGGLPRIQEGSGGWGVPEYQYMLQDLGYYRGPVDGLHLEITDDAVRAFQADNGLAVDGIVGDGTWPVLINAYLSRYNLNVPAGQFMPNAKDGCDGGIVRWLGCGERAFLSDTPQASCAPDVAWRPNRRTEVLFVRAEEFPCEIPEPVTFRIQGGYPAGTDWCLGPGDPDKRCCFITRDEQTARNENIWLFRPAEPGEVTVKGSIRFSDGRPLANTKYAMIAPDGKFMDGEELCGATKGRAIPGKTDANGEFSYSTPTPVGHYILEINGLLVARLAEQPAEEAKGNVVCKHIKSSDDHFDVIVTDLAVVGVQPSITPASDIVVVKKPHTNPARVLVTLRVNQAFTGTGTFERSSDRIRFFDAATGGTEITFDGVDNVFTSAQLTAGVQLFAEGASPSAALDDVTLVLRLVVNSQPGLSDTRTMTAVELTLSIFQSRTAVGVDPNPLSEADKINVGRFVHVQDPGFHAGRALLVVGQPQPPAFNRALDLTALNARVRLFGAADEIATAGQAVLNSPFEIPDASAIPPDGLRFWVEGATVSGALRDTGFQLGVRGVEPDGDRVVVTVVRLHHLTATIPVTPAQTARLGNSPVPPHVHNHATGAAPAAADHDEDFAVNAPVVLLENSVVAANPIALSVQVDPAGVPVSWSVQRDTRPAPDGDNAAIIALSPNPTPTLTPNGGNPLQATLIADAVGSFHIRPFVDANGNGTYDHNIDREPNVVLNMVLVRVTLNVDSCIARNNFTVTALAGNGIRVRSGVFNIANPATAAIHLNAQADLVGGGGDGRRGLANVFGGWINNESANEAIAGQHNDTATAPPTARSTPSVFASNSGAATGVMASSGGAVFIPGNPAPALVAPPLLDSGQAVATVGTGGNTATLTTSRIRTRTALALGQRLLVEAVDSPGDSEDGTHPGFATAQLVTFTFGLTFTAYLCFWTNLSGNIGATGDPADRLYTTLLEINWQQNGQWNINPATGAITVVTAPSTTITGRVPHAPIVRAEDTTAEVRFPTGLALLARDGRN